MKVDGRKQVTRCKRRYLYATFGEKRVSSNNQRLGSILRKRRKCCFNLATGTRVKNLDLAPSGRCRPFNILDYTFGGNRIGPIDKQGNTGRARHQFLQYTQTFCAQL